MSCVPVTCFFSILLLVWNFRQGDGKLRPLVFLALQTYLSAMGMDDLEHIVQAYAKSFSGLVAIFLVFGSTLKAIEYRFLDRKSVV